MKWTMQLTLMLCWVALMSKTNAYPVESKPLNNNPESWNFGDGWNFFNTRDDADPSASALTSDVHIKKSKITPKSIFIAPNLYNDHPCPHGFRVDDKDGKCIKTVTINQDEVLAERIKDLFGSDENHNTNTGADTFDYDYDDVTTSEKDSGPLQFSLPLYIEETFDGKKVEYVIEKKVDLRNLDPKNLTTTEKPIETTTTTTTSLAPVTEITESVKPDEPITIMSGIATSTESIVEETATTIETTLLPEKSTVKFSEDEVTTSTLEPTTVETVTNSTTAEATTVTTTTTTTTAMPKVKIFSVDFLPKSQRKSNRLGQASARFKNSRDQEKIYRPRKQKTTANSTKTNEKAATKLYKIDRNQNQKKNRTRTGSKRPGQRKTTTEVITEASVASTTTMKPFWWLPRNWTIDESKEKPVLVRFWSNQPLQPDETARSRSSRQRVNSRMPSESIFREISPPELDSV